MIALPFLWEELLPDFLDKLHLASSNTLWKNSLFSPKSSFYENCTRQAATFQLFVYLLQLFVYILQLFVYIFCNMYSGIFRTKNKLLPQCVKRTCRNFAKEKSLVCAPVHRCRAGAEAQLLHLYHKKVSRPRKCGKP